MVVSNYFIRVVITSFLISQYLSDNQTEATSSSPVSERRAIIADRWERKRARDRKSTWSYDPDPHDDPDDYNRYNHQSSYHSHMEDDFDDLQDIPSSKIPPPVLSTETIELKRYPPPALPSSSTYSARYRPPSPSKRRDRRHPTSSFPEFDEYNPRTPGGAPKRHDNANRRDDEDDYEDDGSYRPPHRDNHRHSEHRGEHRRSRHPRRHRDKHHSPPSPSSSSFDDMDSHYPHHSPSHALK